jgi:hypothetical protein
MALKTIKCVECGYENRSGLCYCERCKRNLHIPLSKVEPPNLGIPHPSSIEHRRDGRLMTALAVLAGFVLGWFTQNLAVQAREGGLFVMLVASLVNPIVVCLVARGFWILVGLIPTLTAMLSLIVTQYHDKHRYEAVSLSAYFHQLLDAWVSIVGFLLVSLVTSLIMHGIRIEKRLS